MAKFQESMQDHDTMGSSTKTGRIDTVELESKRRHKGSRVV